jgi:hypothetical protein
VFTINMLKIEVRDEAEKSRNRIDREKEKFYYYFSLFLKINLEF